MSAGRMWMLAGRTGPGDSPREYGLDPGFTASGRAGSGFMALLLARRTRSVMLMVPVCPESGFLGRAARPGPFATRR